MDPLATDWRHLQIRLPPAGAAAQEEATISCRLQQAEVPQGKASPDAEAFQVAILAGGQLSVVELR